MSKALWKTGLTLKNKAFFLTYTFLIKKRQNEVSIRFIFTIPFSKKNHSLFLKPFNMEYYYTRLCIKQSFELLNIRQAYLQSMKTRWKNEIFYTLVGGFGDRRLRSEGTDRGFWIRLSLVFIDMIVGGSQIIMFLKSIILEVDKEIF